MAGDPDTFRVSPSLTQLPMVVAPEVRNAAPEQLVAAGQAVTNAGRVASTLIEDHLKELNATRVTEALTTLTSRRNEMSTAALSETGKNALERPDGKSLDEEFGGEFDNTVENLELGLGNNAQRKMFRQRADAMGVEFRGRVQAHVAEQSRAYQLETFAGMADTFSVQLANAREQGEINEAISGITTAANNIFGIKGTPKEARGAVLTQLLTPGHTAQLTRMIEAEEIDGAEEYLNQYRDQIEPGVASKLEGALIEQRNIITGNDLGEQIASAHLGTAATVEPAAPGVKIEGFKDTGLPIVGTVTNTFRQHTERGSAGLDIAAREGTPIRLPYGGKVVDRGFNDRAGNYVIIDHGGGVVTSYSHLQGPPKVARDATIAAGTVLGNVGQTGHATGPHLHYRVKVNGKDVDPQTFHNGKAPPPQATASGGVVGSGQGTLQSALEDLYARNLPRQQEEAAERRIRSLHGAREEADSKAKEGVRNKAFAEIDTTGRLSDSTRASLIGSGQADLIPSLRSFEKATKDRREGGVVDDASSLEVYGAALVDIANGDVDGLQGLLKYKPYLSDSQYKQLTDDFAKGPKDTQSRVAALVKELNIDARYSGVFEDEDGKFDKKKYQRYIGAVESTIREREAVSGKLLLKEERRQVVLGLLAEENMGRRDNPRLFDVRVLYDNIPSRARINSIRALKDQGIANPSISDVVKVWRQLTPGQRRAYEGQ